MAGIETVFIMTSEEFGFTSSSLIKQIVSLGGNPHQLSGLLPARVHFWPKTDEAEGIFRGLRDSFMENAVTKFAGFLAKPAMKRFKQKLDYTEYGGAPLLGVRGVCIIGHGSSNDNAIFNGIRVAYEFAKSGTNERIEREFASRPSRRPVGSGEEPEAVLQ